MPRIKQETAAWDKAGQDKATIRWKRVGHTQTAVKKQKINEMRTSLKTFPINQVLSLKKYFLFSYRSVYFFCPCHMSLPLYCPMCKDILPEAAHSLQS